MKITSISGYSCYVKDLEKTAKFYQELGFLSGKSEEDRKVFRINWFSVEFILDKEKAGKGEGVLFGMTVDNAEETYKELVAKGLKPESEPKVRPDGKNGFILKDPDGYQLLFFTKKY